MNLFGSWPYVAVIPFVSSIVFFALAKDEPLLRRCFASIHGWAALSIIPFSALMATHYPDLGTSIGSLFILLPGCLSAVSVFYCIATVKARWAYHLLHIPTVFTIALSGVASVLMLAYT